MCPYSCPRCKSTTGYACPACAPGAEHAPVREYREELSVAEVKAALAAIIDHRAGVRASARRLRQMAS